MVERTSTYRPSSGFPKAPKTFFKALSLAHQRLSNWSKTSVSWVLALLLPNVHPLVGFTEEHSYVVNERKNYPLAKTLFVVYQNKVQNVCIAPHMHLMCLYTSLAYWRLHQWNCQGTC
jgi:hypothetical protein